MIRAAALYGLTVALAFGVVAAACYATTGPVPTCTENPWQPQCPPPIHNERGDAGR